MPNDATKSKDKGRVIARILFGVGIVGLLIVTGTNALCGNSSTTMNYVKTIAPALFVLYLAYMSWPGSSSGEFFRLFLPLTIIAIYIVGLFVVALRKGSPSAYLSIFASLLSTIATVFLKTDQNETVIKQNNDSSNKSEEEKKRSVPFNAIVTELYISSALLLALASWPSLVK